METRANYVLLGLFTILMGLAVILFSLWISKAHFAKVNTYDVVFSSPINGLAKGGDVRFNGIKVGEVTSLRIDAANPQRVIARIDVEAPTPVRTSSEAKLASLGLTGVSLIQLTAGDLKDPLLVSAFGRPPPRLYAQPGSLDDLMAAGKDAAAQADEALKQLRLVLSNENIAHFSSTLKSLDATSAKLAARDGAIDNLAAAARSVTRLSDDTHGKLDQLAAKADSALGKIDRAAGSVADTADVAADQAAPNVAAAANDLRALSESLAQLSGEMADGRFSLIPGGAPAKPVVKVRP